MENEGYKDNEKMKERLRIDALARHSEEYRAQRKRANQSYKAIAEINNTARSQHMSYGQYVAAEWAKEHVKAKRPKEGKE